MPAAKTSAKREASPSDAFIRKSLTTIFVALLIDILAFTIILPLYPRLLDHYQKTDGQDEIGNAISMLLWIFSKSFLVFVLSRVVGGLTEGNVQMSIAMISDITTEETRSRGLALVGIAFSLGFTVGPALGAYFASLDLVKLFPILASYSVNSYSMPALFAFVLIIVETIYMAVALPETLNFKQRKSKTAKGYEKGSKEETEPLLENDSKSAGSPLNTKALLGRLSLIHFLYLFLFSGMEFTLTFLTHDRFHFTHGEQGKYLGYIGIITALVQGGYVRRVAHKSIPEKNLVVQGITSCAIGLGILGAFATTRPYLYLGATFLAFTSGTVVTSLTSLASLAGSSSGAPGSSRDPDEHKQGKVLGEFRSLGQLGRSIGPLVACSGYWILGSRVAYVLYSGAMFILAVFVVAIIPKAVARVKAKRE
ncbi:hypothetical protein HDU67_006336 [Dinochytrium kinnereticum]|nr:hypothetical protein HDU67_006336 [Dinochytrium kinnereticum]